MLVPLGLNSTKKTPFRGLGFDLSLPNSRAQYWLQRAAFTCHRLNGRRQCAMHTVSIYVCVHTYKNSRIQTRECHVCNAPAPTACSPHPEYNLGPEKLSKVRGTRTKAGTSSASGLPFPDPASGGHRSSYFSAINLLQRPCVRPGMAGASPILLEPTILTAQPRLGDKRSLALQLRVPTKRRQRIIAPTGLQHP